MILSLGLYCCADLRTISCSDDLSFYQEFGNTNKIAPRSKSDLYQGYVEHRIANRIPLNNNNISTILMPSPPRLYFVEECDHDHSACLTWTTYRRSSSQHSTLLELFNLTVALSAGSYRQNGVFRVHEHGFARTNRWYR